jgi:rhodanese-related sulfurtransferase
MMQFMFDNWLLIAAAIVSGGLLVWPTISSSLLGPALSQHEATRMINDRDATIVDVRESKLFAAGHLPNARSIEPTDLSKRLTDLPPKRPVIVVCEDGRAASSAAKTIRQSGREDVHVLDGGMAAWRASGLPVATLKGV